MNFANVAAAWLALGIALLSLLASRKALRLSEAREKRQLPRLVIYLADGYFRTLPGSNDRIYAFLLSISNPADSDNAIAEIQLCIKYRVTQKPTMVIKISSDATLKNFFDNPMRVTLQIPVRVDAHQTIQGWCLFRADSVLFKGALIEGYEIGFIDSHKIEHSIEPIIISEYVDAV